MVPEILVCPWEYRREIDYDQGEQQAYVEQHAALLTTD